MTFSRRNLLQMPYFYFQYTQVCSSLQLALFVSCHLVSLVHTKYSTIRLGYTLMRLNVLLNNIPNTISSPTGESQIAIQQTIFRTLLHRDVCRIAHSFCTECWYYRHLNPCKRTRQLYFFCSILQKRYYCITLISQSWILFMQSSERHFMFSGWMRLRNVIPQRHRIPVLSVRKKESVPRLMESPKRNQNAAAPPLRLGNSSFRSTTHLSETPVPIDAFFHRYS